MHGVVVGVIASLLLDVPFVPQSEALCGGAAVSMVMRYWSADTLVHAEDFSALVDARAGGIAVGALARAVEERGWRAHAFIPSAMDVQSHIGQGRPVIALIDPFDSRALAQGKGRTLHYVVVVAWTADRVVFHDPAVNPFRSLDVTAFDRAWKATGRTALLVLPAPSERSAATPVEGPAQDASNEAGALFMRKRYKDAASLATLAVERDPNDLAAWQLLAASRYLEGDPYGALDAWNQRQEPRVDLANIDGFDRTRYDVAASVLNLPAKSVLTRDALARAERRIAAMPSVHVSRVSYSPRESGAATIDVAVVERPMLPRTRSELLAVGLSGAVMREAKLNIASPSGNGEVWTAAARWWSGRPRVAVSLATPKLAKWTGLWQLGVAWERQTYALPTGTMQDDRRHASFSFGDWRTANTRYQVGAALDRWNSGATYVSIAAEIEKRFADDHLAVVGASSVSTRFSTATMSGRWRSSRAEFTGITAAATLAGVTERAPLDFWPGGDTGVVRSTLLRAHPLLEHGAVKASELHRMLAHATVEFQKPLVARPLVRFGWATFVDATPHHVDAGAGLRVKVPGAPGVVRVDLARGLRDGRVALSAAWQPAW